MGDVWHDATWFQDGGESGSRVTYIEVHDNWATQGGAYYDLASHVTQSVQSWLLSYVRVLSSDL